jgi:HAD superfamily hydrolase (TIGR01509 family)
MMSNIRLIIFDLDGVLCDTPDMHYNTFSEAYHLYTSINISKREHDIDFNGLSTITKLNLLKKRDGLTQATCDLIWNKKQELTLEYIENHIDTDFEKIELLKNLKSQGYLLACASNAIKNTIVKILNKIGIHDYFDCVFSNEDVKNPKPSAEIYLKTMIALNCNPSDTLIIEDSQVGYDAAMKTNAHVLRVVNSQDVNIETINYKLSKIQDTRMKQKYENKNLNVIIPMAGAGARFEQAGYIFPKPLIEIGDKIMIQVVVECLNISANYIFIVREEHNRKYSISDYLKNLIPDAKIILTDGLTEGAACTVLLAKDYINNDNPILMANSDQYIEWDVFGFMKNNISNNLDASILTFEATHPKWSFAKLNEDGCVIEVAEKKPISNIATVGVYWWNKGSDFVKYAEQMIDKNVRVNNEFYVCPVFNEAIADGKKIGVYNTDVMFGLGTPSDLDYFLESELPSG